MCRHAIYHAILEVLFSVVPIMRFSSTFKCVISVIFLICVTMCSYAITKTELVGYCEAMVCMNVCSAQMGAVLKFSLWWENLCLRWLSELTRTLSMPQEKCMDFKNKHYMILLWLCSILMAPVVCAFNPSIISFYAWKYGDCIKASCPKFIF